jgi:hypothetical protein
LILFFVGFFSTKVQAQYGDYEIKAATVHTFMRYVTWSDDAFDRRSNKIILVIYGSDPFGSVIDNLCRGRTIKGRYVEIRRTSELKELKGAHVVFVSRSERNNVCRILEYIKDFKRASVLTIGDNIEGFCEKGGMVKLNGNGNYYFSLNWNEMSNYGPVPDTRLLGMAEKLITTDQDRCQ